MCIRDRSNSPGARRGRNRRCGRRACPVGAYGLRPPPPYRRAQRHACLLYTSYGDDLRRAKTILTEIVQADPRILPEPAPRIAVNELGESSVNLVVRPYVRTAEYDATRADLLEQIKLRFDEVGIPLNPQRPLRLLPPLSDAPPADPALG